jgi:adenylate cyclase
MSGLQRSIIERQRNADAPSVYIHTTPRKSSIARMSMHSKKLPAYLVYTTDTGAQQRFDLTKDKMTIGRKDDNDIVLMCPQISKLHATLETSDAGHLIRDNNSVNGIHINGDEVKESKYLRNGDLIQLGSVVLEFHSEVEVTPFNWRELAQSHPAFSSYFNAPKAAGSKPDAANTKSSPLMNPKSATAQILIESQANKAATFRAPNALRGKITPHRRTSSQTNRRSMTSTHSQESPSNRNSQHINLVTILPSDKKYEETITVRAELDGDKAQDDFMPAEKVQSEDMLRADYEKLRLAYELSKLGVTDISTLLDKTLDLMFSVLPVVDRGVVLLRDRRTGILSIEKVKIRENKGHENREILLSSTVLKKVYDTKASLIVADAFEDPHLGKSESIARGMIRSVICVPLVAHNEVHGILHLDSQDRLNSFAEKDMALVRAIGNQTAVALENCKLLQDIENEAMIREALGRFLPPHVVDRCVQSGEEPIRKGGRMIEGTILFADIRGFTAMSERSSPQEVVDLLNDFFERLVKIVFKYNGVLDKYIGDCLMAAFGTLPDQEDAEYNAVCAALEFKEAIAEMNFERELQGKEPLSIGVGLNTGNLVAGYIGSSQRLEYTCIGDTVNTASRICSMAEDNEVLISEFTYEKVKDRIECGFHAKKVFKGKSTETSVYQAFDVKQ